MVIRTVVDTNILVRARIKPFGSVGPILRRLHAQEYRLLYSDELIDELLEVLNRPRIRHKYHLTDEDIEDTLSLVLLRGEAIRPTVRVSVCRDPDDDKILEVALAGRADVIVSGDDDLLVLGEFQGIPIVTPAVFLRLLDHTSA